MTAPYRAKEDIMSTLKRTIALFLTCCLMVMSLAACGNTDTAELEELRGRVEELEKKVAKYEGKKSDTMATEDAKQEETTQESEDDFQQSTAVAQTTEKVSAEITEQEQSEVLQKYLEEQLASNNPQNWLWVAECEYATEEHLIQVAEQVVVIDYYSGETKNKEKAVEITRALSANFNTTDDIMEKVVESKFPDVWEVVAKSEKAREKALLKVATRIAGINYYSGEVRNEEKTTEIAKVLVANPKVTAEALQKLSISRFPKVVQIGHDAIEALGG